MSKESEDSGDGLQQDLQPAAPSGGKRGGRRRGGPCRAAGAGGGQRPARRRRSAHGPTRRPRAGQPGLGPLLLRRRRPRGAGPLPGVRSVHGVQRRCAGDGPAEQKLQAKVDAYRVELIDQLFAERGGRDALDVVSRIAIENYALVCAQFKTIEARLDQDGLFTQTGRRRSAFDMLKAISETIDRLRAELPPPITRPSQDAGIAAMPSSALHMAAGLLERQIAGETLTAFEEGQLSVLLHASHGHVLLPPDPVDVPDIPAYRRQADAEIVEPGATSQAVSSPNPHNRHRSQPASGATSRWPTAPRCANSDRIFSRPCTMHRPRCIRNATSMRPRS